MYVKTMSVHGSHLGWRLWSPDTIFESILPKDHPCHVCFKLADWFQRRRLLNNFPIGPMLKLCPLTAAILNRDRGHCTQFWLLQTWGNRNL